MNYKGHLGVGVLTAGVVANQMDIKSEFSFVEISIFLILAIIGASKIIDQDLKFAIFLPQEMRHKRYLYHRQITHSLMLWVVILLIALFGLGLTPKSVANMEFNINYYILFFAIGGLSHLLADMLTGSIPIFLYGKYGRGYRIGINIDVTKKLFVKLGDKLSPIMVFLGIFLIFYDGNMQNIQADILESSNKLIDWVKNLEENKEWSK